MPISVAIIPETLANTCDVPSTKPSILNASHTKPLALTSKSILKNVPIYIVYDEQYKNSSEQQDLIVPLQTLSESQVLAYILTNDNVETLVSQIPKDGVVVLHADCPPNMPAGGQFLALRQLLIKAQFPRVIGHTPEFCELTMHKSTMNALFLHCNIPHAVLIIVKTISEILSKKTQTFVQDILDDGGQVFLKIDGGFNSTGLKNGNVVSNMGDLNQVAQSMVKEFGPVVIQRYLPGREFTCAVCTTPHGPVAFHPIERIFAPGQLYSPPNGTISERVLDSDKEFALIQKCRQVSESAYCAVNGCAWGRVDLRCDGKGHVFVLEVNNTASFAVNSYLDMSVRASGYTRLDVLEFAAQSVLQQPKSVNVSFANGIQ